MNPFSTQNVSGQNESNPIVPSKEFHKVRLVEINVTSNDNGSETYLDFVFKEEETGRKITDRIFEPKDRSNEGRLPYDGYTFDKDVERVMNHVKHIMLGYMDADRASSIVANDWAGFCNQVKGLFPQGFENVVATLKVTYNKKGFSQVPNSPNFLSVSGREPKGGLTIGSYDIYEKPATQSAGGGVDNPSVDFPEGSAPEI